MFIHTLLGFGCLEVIYSKTIQKTNFPKIASLTVPFLEQLLSQNTALLLLLKFIQLFIKHASLQFWMNWLFCCIQHTKINLKILWKTLPRWSKTVQNSFKIRISNNWLHASVTVRSYTLSSTAWVDLLDGIVSSSYNLQGGFQTLPSFPLFTNKTQNNFRFLSMSWFSFNIGELIWVFNIFSSS